MFESLLMGWAGETKDSVESTPSRKSFANVLQTCKLFFFVIYCCNMFASLVCFINICNVSFLRSINSYVDLGG